MATTIISDFIDANAGDPTKPAKPVIMRDPDSVLDYSEDWGDWLVLGVDPITSLPAMDTLQTVAVTFNDPLCTLVAEKTSTDGRYAVVWLSGGRVGTTEACTIQVITNQGRIDERTLYFRIKDR